MNRYLPIPINKLYFACSNGYIYNKKGKRVGSKNSNGYNIVYIKHRDTNKFKCYYVHRLIWITFNGDIPEGMEIDHIIPVKNGGTDELSNLRLVTHKENMNNTHTIERFIKTRNDSVLRGKYIYNMANNPYNTILTEEEKKERKRNYNKTYYYHNREKISEYKKNYYLKQKSINTN